MAANRSGDLREVPTAYIKLFRQQYH